MFFAFNSTAQKHNNSDKIKVKQISSKKVKMADGRHMKKVNPKLKILPPSLISSPPLTAPSVRVRSKTPRAIKKPKISKYQSKTSNSDD